MNLTSIKRIWSSQQTEIFNWFANGIGNLVIRARAGTGKTTTLIEAFSHAPSSCKAILYAVFNKRNQLEAEGKICDARVTVKTLHSVGYMFIRLAWGKVKGNFYSIEYDRTKQAFPGISPGASFAVVKLVSWLKNNTIALPSDRDVLEAIVLKDIAVSLSKDDKDNGWNEERLCDVAQKVLKISMERSYEISGDDMVWLPNVLGIVKPTFDLVCIDEFQDMSLPQLTMGIACMKPGGRFVGCGDDRQAIYSFRGAVMDAIDKYKKKLFASELGLTVTYRCPKLIVELAKGIVDDYQAHDTAPQGTIAQGDVKHLCDTAETGDVVLSRLNAPLMRICLSLLKRGKTARIEGKDIGKDLNKIVRDIEGVTVQDFIDNLAAWKTAMSSKVKPNRTAAQRLEKIEDMHDMIKAVAETCKGVKDIANKISSLFSDHEDKPKPAIVCSSVHKAKGLEWPNVYMLTETFRLNKFNADSTEAQRELENLRYVCITRTQSKLTTITGIDQMTGLLPLDNQP